MSRKVLILDVEQIRLLTNYCNWIPIIHGFTAKFVKETYPGWAWNDLIPKMIKQGLITIQPDEGDIKLWQGLWLKAGITEVTAIKNGKVIKFKSKRETHV